MATPDVSKLGSASEDEGMEEGPESSPGAEDEERLDAAKMLIAAVKKGDAAAVVEALDYFSMAGED